MSDSEPPDETPWTKPEEMSEPSPEDFPSTRTDLTPEERAVHQPEGRRFPPTGARVGTPKQIQEVQDAMDLLRAQQPWDKAQRRQFQKLCLAKARLTRRKERLTRNKLKLRLVKAQSAEKISRQTLEQAAAATQVLGRALAGTIETFVKVAREDLAPHLAGLLNSEDKEESRAAMASLTEITLALLNLQKSATQQKHKAERVIASWPAEGEKS